MLKTLQLILIVILIATTAEAATPKLKPCKPNTANICVPKARLPKTFRSKLALTPDEGFLTPLEQYPNLESLGSFPEDNITPQVLIPAGTETMTLCRLVQGKLECTVLTKFKDCPLSISIQDENSGKFYDCELDCGASTHPDENGNCDCDIKYNTCK
jgi:hypothetical protein